MQLLSAEIMSSKLSMRKMDKNLESLLETAALGKTQSKLPETKTASAHVLEEFPLKNLDQLHKVERRLKKEELFHSQVVRYFIFYCSVHCN